MTSERNEPPSESGSDPDDPPRQLVYAIEYLVDDYGLDVVRAAVVEVMMGAESG